LRLTFGAARNILLFSLLADDTEGENIDLIWNFYYDMYLTIEAHKLLTTQARKLADLSTSMDVWENGDYGKWMRMCTAGTLKTLNSLWKNYASTDQLSNTQKKAFTLRYNRSKSELEAFYKTRAASAVAALLGTGPLGFDADFQKAVK
jgi:hypothetical protein